MKKKLVKSRNCLNCSAELNGENFCPECGQVNDSRFPTLKDFIGDSISNFMALDGKFLLTLRTLFHKPGYLAKEFVNGRRVKYMPPLRIYFLSSIVLLFILNTSKDGSKIVQVKDSPPKQEEQTVEKTFAATTSNYQSNNSNQKANTGLLALFAEMYEFSETHPELTTEEGLMAMQLESNWKNNQIFTLATKATNMDDEEFSRYFYSKMFWVLFLFLPIFAFLLKLIYIRRKFKYLEHLFFSFYTQSAFFIMMSMGLMATAIFKSSFFIVITSLIFIVYLWYAMKRFYGQGRWKTTFKFLLINTGYIVFSIWFMALAAAVSFIIY